MGITRFTILFAVIFAVAVVGYGQPTSRILGGEEAPVGNFNYVASVRVDGAHVCGGSIVDTQYILTAAHCVSENATAPYETQRVSARVGSVNQFAGGSIVYAGEIIINSAYGDFKNDVALIKLQKAIVPSAKIEVIPIATESAEEPPVDAKVVVAGWGEQSTNAAPYRLHFTTFTVANETVCTDAFDKNDESTICLAHGPKQGSCRGDAGNGAAYNGKLVAVSNYIVGACGARYPDVFANVVYFADWIKKIVTADS